jgi:hypothetical protein
MIQFTAHMRILVATSPLDMRKGMDGVAAHCRLALGENPMSGAVFLFISRSRKHLRILTYDGQGFWLATKRLSTGRFPHWVKADETIGKSAFIRELQACQAQVLLQGADPLQVHALSAWKKIA